MHITIISHGTKRAPRTNRTIDCRHLPNPHDVEVLRPRDGRDPMVTDWLTSHDETRALIATEASRIPTITAGQLTIGTMCSAGRHRSVVIAEALAHELTAQGHDVEVRHSCLKEVDMAKSTKTTTERGLGWDHQQQRARLLKLHVDGTPCWWCGEPMYRSQALDADHIQARGNGGRKADRLLHASCNRSRQKGERDDQRPALRRLPAARVFHWPER
ncbi:HNH endonuclease [Corynebacterium phage Dina]|nr:HNH endonuclease [Corynebacterium phage Dina]QDF19683.1 HNH endonuclease [Corynebacterium phage Dina]